MDITFIVDTFLIDKDTVLYCGYNGAELRRVAVMFWEETMASIKPDLEIGTGIREKQDIIF
jgi:hypothetical protein